MAARCEDFGECAGSDREKLRAVTGRVGVMGAEAGGTFGEGENGMKESLQMNP
jgi:hypothetical protein